MSKLTIELLQKAFEQLKQSRPDDLSFIVSPRGYRRGEIMILQKYRKYFFGEADINLHWSEFINKFPEFEGKDVEGSLE